MNIIDKVEKLYAKANHPSTSPEEAKTYTEMAEALMIKYSIDQTVLSNGERTDTIIHRFIACPNPFGTDKRMLLSVIAKAFGCQSIHFSGSDRNEVIGYESDVNNVEFLLGHLNIQAMGEMLMAGVNGVHDRKSFLYGFTEAVKTRLSKNVKEAVAETPGSAVAIYDRDQAVNAKVRELHPHLRTTSVSRGIGQYGAGHAAGMRADIGQSRMRGGVQRAIGG